MVRRLAPLAAVIASALVFSWAFPPVHTRVLAWVALVPLLVVVRTSRRMRGAAAAAALWGMLAAWATTDWLPPALELYYRQPYWLGFLLFATAAFLMGALEYAAFAVLYRALAARVRVALPLLAAAAWAVAEFGRDHLLTGNPWGLLGYSQTPLSTDGGAGMWLAARVVQAADLGGVYAVGALLVVANAAIAELVLLAWPALGRGSAPRHAQQPKGAGPSIVGVALASAVIAASLLYGQNRLQATPLVDGGAGVLLVQANVDLGSQWDPAFYGLLLREHLDLTTGALGLGGDIDLVVWPENAMTFFVDREPAYRTAIAGALAPHDVQLLAGAPRHSEEASVRYFNSAVLLDSDGDVRASYDKQHLLPFAEYFPLGSAGFLRRSFGRVREFSPGERQDSIESRIGRLGILICNEAMFPWLARERVAFGAEVLVNLSNDTWVASPKFAEQQLAIASMRAVEQRRDLVRASTWGPSAIVDSRGFLRGRTATNEATTLAGRVARLGAVSPYQHFGDGFVAVCALAVVLAFVRTGRRRQSP